MAKIYTKTGDKGETSLVGGQRVSKSDVRIEVYGTIDELNSHLGLARAALSKVVVLDNQLERIQNWLFNLGSLLAAEPTDRAQYQLPAIQQFHIQFLESSIDEMSSKLAPLKQFVLPAGTDASARIHCARTVARRAERLLLSKELAEHRPALAVEFLNRLSDYLFVAARYANHEEGVADVPWRKDV